MDWRQAVLFGTALASYWVLFQINQTARKLLDEASRIRRALEELAKLK